MTKGKRMKSPLVRWNWRPANQFLLVCVTLRAILRAQQPAKKGGEKHNMKYLALIALAAMALGLGACASKDPAPAPAPASTGMSK
jgi:hypothetical protein